MHLSIIDTIVFILFIVGVVTLGLTMGRSRQDSESYFLAGRGLRWWLIGFSLIAANISTEQFVGMSGQAADYIGLAIASYEWMAAITLVVVAFVFLPKFLSTGIYTIPEYLEYRYNTTSRSIMAFFTMVIYVGVTIAAVIYSGALTLHTLFPEISLITGAWIIGAIAAIYVAVGGLKACAWADLLQGSALIVGGAIITWLAFTRLGETPLAELAHSATSLGGLTDDSSGIAKFFGLNSDKLRMVLPASDLILPWTALVVGLWIPNFYYWGLNQYITQRTLGAHSLAEGQKGIVFAAGLKLLIPFVIVFPGIAAFNLFSDEMHDAARNDAQIQKGWIAYESARAQPGADGQYPVFTLTEAFLLNHTEKANEILAYNAIAQNAAAAANVPTTTIALAAYKYDSAFGLLISRLVPSGKGLQGFIIAAILGAVVSSLASMLNAASTIFTMDLYKKYLRREASEKHLVLTGRICVVVFVIIGCLIAPLLGDPRFGGIFTYIQEFQGFISPGILAVFVFGLIVRRAPPACGVVGLLINPLCYWLLKMALPGLSFLDRMAISFGSVLLIMLLITLWKPLAQPIVMPKRATIAMDSSKGALWAGCGVVATTLLLYIIFW